MTHKEYVAIKVGVTTTRSSKDRIDHHKAGGWTLVSRWRVATGDEAEKVEARVLKWWRNEIGAPAVVPKEAMPQGGASETASLSLVDIYETISYIDSEIRRMGELKADSDADPDHLR